MLTNYYQLYIDSVFALAETVVIKSSYSAESINKFIAIKHGRETVSEYPHTWKYYLNISGNYHFSDEKMYITSLDTLEQIEFTKENLDLHRATYRGYLYGTRLYTELVTQYPLQESLILGILYPADIDKAIAAEDGDILAYPKYLIEENEETLIYDLEVYIKKFLFRWYNKQFNLSDSLYCATVLGILYTNLVPAIINIRLRNCKTRQAHSYHVREYLASHGNLDRYLNYLTTKQALFFYRNIAYIERHSGSRDTFDWLVKNIFTERQLPLSEVNMKHDSSVLPDSLYNKIDFRLKPLNEQYNSNALTELTFDELLEKELLLAPGNFDYVEDKHQAVKEKFENSLSSKVATKVLYSGIVDYTDATPFTLEDVLFNHWAYLSSVNHYNTYIRFKNPRTGNTVPISVKDAFIYAWYCLSKACGVEVTHIPTFRATRVQRIPTPNINDIYKVVDKNYIKKDLGVELINMQPEIPILISTEAFYNKCVEIFNVEQIHLKYIGNQEHSYRRALVQNMVNRLYMDINCEFRPTLTTMASFIDNSFLPQVDYTKDEYMQIFLDLTMTATGADLNTTLSLRNLQRIMVELMTQLSSYSIHFIRDINSSNIKVINNTAVRVADRLGKSFNSFYTPELNVWPIYKSTLSKHKYFYDVDLPEFNVRHSSKHHFTDDIINVKPNVYSRDITYYKSLYFNTLDAFIYTPGDTEESILKTSMSGSTVFYNLTEEDKLHVKSIYKDCFKVYEPPKIDFGEIFDDYSLGGYEYIPFIDNHYNNYIYPGFVEGTNAFTMINTEITMEEFKWALEEIQVDFGIQLTNI